MIGSYGVVEVTLSPRCLRATPKLLLLKRSGGGGKRKEQSLELISSSVGNSIQQPLASFIKIKFTNKIYVCPLQSLLNLDGQRT